jgi:hypothetical protein
VRINREGKYGRCDVLCIHLYENRTMKPVETVLRGGEGDEGEREVNLIKIYCKHIRKCHNEHPYN